MVSSWGLGRAAVCDCGTPWTFLLPVFNSTRRFVLCLTLCYFVFISPFSIAITPLGEERELFLVRLFCLRMFGFVCFLLLLVSGKGCGLCLWHSLNFSLTVFSTDRSKAVVPMLVLLFVALWFILRGYLFYVLPCVILFLFQSF